MKKSFVIGGIILFVITAILWSLPGYNECGSFWGTLNQLFSSDVRQYCNMLKILQGTGLATLVMANILVIYGAWQRNRS